MIKKCIIFLIVIFSINIYTTNILAITPEPGKKQTCRGVNYHGQTTTPDFCYLGKDNSNNSKFYPCQANQYWDKDNSKKCEYCGITGWLQDTMGYNCIEPNSPIVITLAADANKKIFNEYEIEVTYNTSNPTRAFDGDDPVDFTIPLEKIIKDFYEFPKITFYGYGCPDDTCSGLFNEYYYLTAGSVNDYLNNMHDFIRYDETKQVFYPNLEIDCMYLGTCFNKDITLVPHWRYRNYDVHIKSYQTTNDNTTVPESIMKSFTCTFGTECKLADHLTQAEKESILSQIVPDGYWSDFWVDDYDIPFDDDKNLEDVIQNSYATEINVYAGLEPCPKGYYCTQNEKKPCPRGSTSDQVTESGFTFGASAITDCYISKDTIFKDKYGQFNLPIPDDTKLYYNYNQITTQ